MQAAWGSDDGGFASDFVAAIEQATRDGVDIINYSLGAAAELTHMTPVETAFRHAAAAGVFVAAGKTGQVYNLNTNGCCCEGHCTYDSWEVKPVL